MPRSTATASATIIDSARATYRRQQQFARPTAERSAADTQADSAVDLAADSHAAAVVSPVAVAADSTADAGK
jgi:hypothetical protein